VFGTNASVRILNLLQNAARLRRTGIRQQQQHVNDQLDSLTPQVNSAFASHDQLRDQVETLQAVISEADDSVFRDFCRKIRVNSIRDYEERQLRVAQAANEARHRFDTQIARLTTQCVSHFTIRFILSSVIG
jgi:structural maintenance of chromosome 1